MPNRIQRLCVFCGSSRGRREAYNDAARRLGRTLAGRDIELVYGGAGIGLMGAVADATLGGGGRVVGVIPRALREREIAHPSLTTLHVVESMHERKARMADLADGFIALPGGAGTLDELFEIFTWAQLGIHAKPIALLDVGGYYERLLAFVDHAVAEGFIHARHRALLLVDDDPDRLLDAMEACAPPSPTPDKLTGDQLLR